MKLGTINNFHVKIGFQKSRPQKDFFSQISFQFKANRPKILKKKIGSPSLHNVRCLCSGLNLLTSSQVAEFAFLSGAHPMNGIFSVW